MTKRRPTNKKPTGMNKSLGNSLSNERERHRKQHKILASEDDLNLPSFVELECEKTLESKTFESNMEELLAKAELSGLSFNAERGAVHVVDKDSTVVKTNSDIPKFTEQRKQMEHLLRIPRRPDKSLYETAEELHALENEQFLAWRTGLSQLEDVDGVVLTPYERNLDIWRELWRVVERSDIVVQVVDARNPLLFRSQDLEDYVTSVDPAKKNLILVNKADLLLSQQRDAWAAYFEEIGVDVVFWSALEDEEQPSTSSKSCCYLSKREDLLSAFRTKAGHVEVGGKPIVVGFVGYPNVGKSSTINKLIGTKKVTVSATPGKTKRLQTIIIDPQLTLCDCPGLVMPSFAFDKHEMFLNGIMPVEQLRDHFGAVSLLITRVPSAWISQRYSLTLPDKEIDSLMLLTSIAFMRGLMSSAGVPDCSRAARLLIREVVCGTILWVAAPPTISQAEFDVILFPAVEGKCKGSAQLRQMEKKGLIVSSGTSNNRFDSAFFDEGGSTVHTKYVPIADNDKLPETKKHFKKKDKLRRIYVGTYA